MEGLVSINGRVSSPSEAKIPALDRGLLYGDGVFEVFVAFDQHILDLRLHLNRLRASAEALAMDIPWSDEELEFELNTLVSSVRAPKKYLRLAVTRGTGLSLKPALDIKPNRYIYCLPSQSETPRIFQEGLNLKRLIKDSHTRGAAPKTGNYLGAVLGIAKAQKEGYDEILWTNGEGEITEAATANIFFMAREGDQVEFLTPPAQSGILLGITREQLLRLMREASIPVKEQTIYADELPRFDEAFVCSTVRGLVPVATIDKHRLHSARATSVYRHIERLYQSWVTSQLGFSVEFASGRRL